ncbi:MAG: hypothetical protein KDA75_02365 [Planctomycetaceae bacterium]|nr:hypothetical protein [Planctomycetaceae bacterium]
MPADTSLLSLAGSIFSTVCTAWFWFVRVRRERPNLTAHLLEHEFFLAHGGGDSRTIGCKAAVVLANNSILPDAVLGARLSVLSSSGGWLPLDGLVADAHAALPINLPPQQTGVIRLTGRLAFPWDPDAEGTRTALQTYLARNVATPIQMQLETLGLNDSTSRFTLVFDPHLEATQSFRVRTAA